VVLIDAAGRSVGQAWDMVLATWWALVAGFALSGAVHAFASRDRLRRALGDHRPRSVLRAAGLGAASSSCSYAAAATAKALVSGGADFTTAMVVMVASTNLVIELGLVMWRLLGWQFVLGQLCAGIAMIALLGMVLPRALATLRRPLPAPTLRSSVTESRHGWGDAARYGLGELRMLRRELAVGFLAAGALAALVPAGWWRALFVSGHGPVADVQNAVIGPLLAAVSCVCSVGNVPLAAALRSGGAAGGGVLSFILGDLLSLPLLAVYRRYYGLAVTVRLAGVFWLVMSVSGLVVQGLFAVTGVHLATPHRQVAGGATSPVTLALDLVATAVLLGMMALARRAAPGEVCGGHVAPAPAPAGGR
jgi:uncharacterized membrane protein YraQ (UPF0718 family)